MVSTLHRGDPVWLVLYTEKEERRTGVVSTLHRGDPVWLVKNTEKEERRNCVVSTLHREGREEKLCG